MSHKLHSSTNVALHPVDTVALSNRSDDQLQSEERKISGRQAYRTHERRHIAPRYGSVISPATSNVKLRARRVCGTLTTRRITDQAVFCRSHILHKTKVVFTHSERKRSPGEANSETETHPNLLINDATPEGLGPWDESCGSKAGLGGGGGFL